MNTDEERERQRGFAACNYLREHKTGFYPIGGWIFMKDGIKYDLSAADVTQWERIEREGLFVIDKPNYPIIQVRGSRVECPTDQFAKIRRVDGGTISIELLGDGSYWCISASDIVGVKLHGRLTITFNVTGGSYLS